LASAQAHLLFLAWCFLFRLLRSELRFFQVAREIVQVVTCAAHRRRHHVAESGFDAGTDRRFPNVLAQVFDAACQFFEFLAARNVEFRQRG
jgi:hypothetical protein